MVTLRKSDPLKLFGKRLLVVLLAMMVISTAWGVWDIYHKSVEAEGLKKEAQDQLAALAARQTKLQTDLDGLKTSRGMEAVLRESYSVGHAGENMIVIVEPPASMPASTTSSGWGWILRVFPW